MSYTRPQFLKLTAQERRVFDALRNGWCNAEAVSRKAAPPGESSSCCPKVLVCKVKRIIQAHGWIVEAQPIKRAPGVYQKGRPPKLYRIIPAHHAARAA